MIRIFDSENDVANKIAMEMRQRLIGDEKPVFCLASGSTPQKSYRQFAGMVDCEERIKKLKFVSLDEWVGIERSSEGSCYQMLSRDLFSRLPIEGGQIVFFDGLSSVLQEECVRMDQWLEEHPITFSLMGVGMNGHIGLNEPGMQILDHSSAVDLSETTKRVAQKYFDRRTVLEKGLTLGLGQIIGSHKVIVAATGEHKAGIVKDILTRPELKLPAQALLGYDHIDVYLDSAAAKYVDEPV